MQRRCDDWQMACHTALQQPSFFVLSVLFRSLLLGRRKTPASARRAAKRLGPTVSPLIHRPVDVFLYRHRGLDHRALRGWPMMALPVQWCRMDSSRVGAWREDTFHSLQYHLFTTYCICSAQSGSSRRHACCVLLCYAVCTARLSAISFSEPSTRPTLPWSRCWLYCVIPQWIPLVSAQPASATDGCRPGAAVGLRGFYAQSYACLEYKMFSSCSAIHCCSVRSWRPSLPRSRSGSPVSQSRCSRSPLDRFSLSPSLYSLDLSLSLSSTLRPNEVNASPGGLTSSTTLQGHPSQSAPWPPSPYPLPPPQRNHVSNSVHSDARCRLPVLLLFSSVFFIFSSLSLHILFVVTFSSLFTPLYASIASPFEIPAHG